jgi:hypothetical protein
VEALSGMSREFSCVGVFHSVNSPSRLDHVPRKHPFALLAPSVYLSVVLLQSTAQRVGHTPKLCSVAVDSVVHLVSELYGSVFASGAHFLVTQRLGAHIQRLVGQLRSLLPQRPIAEAEIADMLSTQVHSLCTALVSQAAADRPQAPAEAASATGVFAQHTTVPLAQRNARLSQVHGIISAAGILESCLRERVNTSASDANAPRIHKSTEQLANALSRLGRFATHEQIRREFAILSLSLYRLHATSSMS